MLDEQLYSRQLYAIGHDAMKKINETNILIVGMSGLGTEIAKNAILFGYKSISIYDDKLVELKDCGSNYYCTEKSIGKKRIDVVYEKLSELNPYVKLSKLNNIDKLDNYSIIVLTQTTLDIQIKINNYCRLTNCRLICANSNGLWGSIFCDFGEHQIIDSDGEPLKSGMITSYSISNDLYTVETADIHHLVTGDLVKIENKTYEIKYVKPNMFSFIEKNVINPKEYEQIKNVSNMSFKSLEESIKTPEFTHTNYMDMDICSILHTINININKSYEELVSIINNEKYNNIIHKALRCIDTECTPINSILGGIAAQEIMKASSNKYTPINQWLYYEAFDIMPEINNDSSNVSRYTDYIKVLGEELQSKVQNSNIFIVGSGAIGCELLKNLAMMGQSTGKGKIIITDMDTIEKSNLNRQFLFRDKNIGQAKSITAASVIKTMNHNINIESQLNRVGRETENIYDETFFKNIDCVLNALDNIDARMYMDSRCVSNKVPLLESGTLSTKGNVQVIIPYLTESYASSSDPAEKQIPVCTIKNFPNSIDHTIQWAREQFEGYFNRMQNNAVQYNENKLNIHTLPITDLISLSNDVFYINENSPKSFIDCLRWAYDLWHELFRNQIIQLLYQFPENHEIKNDKGDITKFWTGLKKCPQVSTFDINNETHYDFVISGAKLWAFSFKLSYSDLNYKEIIQEFQPKPYTINTNIKISATDEEEKKRLESLEKIEDDPEKIINKLQKINIICYPTDFEKDDDSNHHIAFITAASNSRAENYGIIKATKHNTKGIAGKIIPALATTTSVIAGLVCLEYYKVLLKRNKITDYKNTFVNLALPLVCSSDPIKAKITKYGPHNYTIWDTFNYSINSTLSDLIKQIENEKSCEIDMIGYNSFIVYSSMISQQKLKQRMDMKIKDIIEQIFGPINSKTITLTLNVIFEDDDVDMPNIILS